MLGWHASLPFVVALSCVFHEGITLAMPDKDGQSYMFRSF